MSKDGEKRNEDLRGRPIVPTARFRYSGPRMTVAIRDNLVKMVDGQEYDLPVCNYVEGLVDRGYLTSVAPAQPTAPAQSEPSRDDLKGLAARESLPPVPAPAQPANEQAPTGSDADAPTAAPLQDPEPHDDEERGGKKKKGR